MNGFDAAYLAAATALVPVAAYKRLRHGKYRESLPGMLGRRLPGRALAAPDVHRCWLHGVSFGETVAGSAMYRELRRRDLGWEFLATTTTETGQAQARKVYKDIEQLAYAPLDFSWVVRAFHRAYRPSVYIFLETEIWPNNLAECARRGVPVFLANGKLSDRSAHWYSRLSGIMRPALEPVRRFFMQTDADAARMARILGDTRRIEVTGNVKFDALPEPLTPDERAEWRARWGAGDDTVVLLAGSTHPGEEEVVLRAYRQVLASFPKALLVIAPRHPERFTPVAEALTKAGATVARDSLDQPPPPADAPLRVVLLDRMGVLARAFGAAEVAMLGGSWATIGGHNLLEPAIHGIPVLRGPNMHAQKEIVRVLGPTHGAPCVREEDLASVLLGLCRNPEERHRLGRMAAAAALSNKGGAVRTVDGILRNLSHGG